MSQEIIMTQEGYDKLIKELEDLKTVKRSQIADKIKTARGFGDLSENSEYDEAKNEQAIMEGRILTLEEQLSRVTVVHKDSIPKDIVSIGSVVTIDDDGFEIAYCLVSSVESSGGENPCITDKSPVGEALLGHRVGDTVEV
ncbi:MAG: transcription elongation factor GreA, partial [Angelakisella sp.]